MSPRRPRLYSVEGRRQFKERSGVELPREPERDPVLAKKLADAALVTDVHLMPLFAILERTRAVLSPTEHRILQSFVKRGIEAPRQLRAMLRVTEPGRDAKLAMRDHENAQLAADVDRRQRRDRGTILDACRALAGKYGATDTALARRYYRAKGLRS